MVLALEHDPRIRPCRAAPCGRVRKILRQLRSWDDQRLFRVDCFLRALDFTAFSLAGVFRTLLLGADFFAGLLVPVAAFLAATVFLAPVVFFAATAFFFGFAAGCLFFAAFAGDFRAAGGAKVMAAAIWGAAGWRVNPPNSSCAWLSS